MAGEGQHESMSCRQSHEMGQMVEEELRSWMGEERRRGSEGNSWGPVVVGGDGEGEKGVDDEGEKNCVERRNGKGQQKDE